MTEKQQSKHLQFRPRRDQPDLQAWVQRVLEDGNHNEKVAAAIRFYIQHGEPDVPPPGGEGAAHPARPKARPDTPQAALPLDLTTSLREALPDLARLIAAHMTPLLSGLTVTPASPPGYKAPPAPQLAAPKAEQTAADRLRERFRRSSGVEDDDEGEEEDREAS